MQNVPFKQQSPQVRALFIDGVVNCIKTTGPFNANRTYKAGVIQYKDYVILPDKTLEVKKYGIHTYSPEVLLTLDEFTKYFMLPEVDSLETAYPVLYKRYYDYADEAVKLYDLIRYEFQIQDLALLLMKDRAMLCLEQGTGKTLLSLLWRKIKGVLYNDIERSLVITQQDLIDQWKEEAQRVGINLQTLNKRSAPIGHKGNYITHFEHIAKFSERYKDKFQCIILDEGHKIKSVNASRGRAIRSLNAKYKLVLTGTPVKNIAKDLHFIFGWLVGYDNEIYPYKESEQHKFRKDFGVYQIMDGHRNLVPEVSCIQELQYLISPIILRRDITELGIPMVKRDIYLVKVQFTDEQRLEYDTIESQYKLAALRIFNWQKNTVLFPGSKKIEVTIRLVNKIIERKEQVIIFTGIMDVAKHLKSIFKGSSEVANSLVPPPLRGELIKRFKNNEFPILIAGLEAVNSGFSLQNANNIIVTDMPWTASTLDQALARCYRIVSKRDVNIYILYTENSYDENKIALIDAKRISASTILDGKDEVIYKTVDYRKQ